MSSTKKNSPENIVCPICKGVGYVRRDVPVGDPQFGKLALCVCQQEKQQKAELNRLLHVSNLDAFSRFSFDSFVTQTRNGKENKTLSTALKAAQHYAHTLNGWFLLMGGYGCGKTHLAAAVAHQVVSLGIGAIFLTVPDLLDWLRSSFSDSDTSFEERFNEIRNVRLLVLDDLGTQNATAWAREKLFQLIDHRYIHRLPTVITTNLNLREIDERIASRLQDKDLVTRVQIDAADYRNPLRDSSVSPIANLAHVSDQRTFERFNTRTRENLKPDERASLEKAFYAAQNFAEQPSGWIIFMGGYGTGKTHLAAAIGQHRISLGNQAVFAVVPDLLDHLRAAFGPNSLISYDNIFNQVRTAELLILDDLGTQNATPWAREKLFQILNYRYETRLPTVITTSSSLDELDPRIRSRMQDMNVCQIFSIITPSYQTIRAVLPKRKI